MNPLLQAIQENKFNQLRLLLDLGYDPNVKDEDDGSMVLFVAAGEGHEEGVRLLLEYGAEVNGRDKKGQTALFEAAIEGREQVARLLLEHGAEVNARDEDGGTALFEASYWGRKDLARLLLEHDAEVNTRDKKGRTALIEAVYCGRSGNKGLDRLLLEYGADLSLLPPPTRREFGRYKWQLKTSKILGIVTGIIQSKKP